MQRILTLLILATSLCMLPACQGARAEFFKSEVGRVLPVPADSEGLKTEIDPSYWTANLTLEFRTRQSPAEVWSYYQRELNSRGFAETLFESGDAIPSPVGMARTVSDVTEKPGRKLRLVEFKRGNDLFWLDFIHLSVSWDSTDGPSEVSIELRHNSYLGEWAKAPVALPVAVVLSPLLVTGEFEGYATIVYENTRKIVDVLY